MKKNNENIASKNLLYVKVASEISQTITEQKLQSGDKLPSERELSVQLNVGRNTVREAIRILENDGIVEVLAQKGTFVKTLDDERSQQDLYIDFVRVDYIELVEMKLLLEQYAARRLLKNAKAKTLLHLEHLLNQMERQAKIGVYDSDTDQAFHLAIIHTHNNKMLVQFCTYLTMELATYAHLVEGHEVWVKTIPDHRDLLQALIAADAVALEAAYRAILDKDLSILRQLGSCKKAEHGKRRSGASD